MIFQAMQDELQRNMEQLHLPNSSKPFYLSYTIKYSSSFEIAGSLGGIINSMSQDSSAVGNVRLLIGNYHRNNDVSYDGSYGLRLPVPADGDYDEIRRNLWLATDAAYKEALQQYAGKYNYLKTHPLAPDEEKTDDFSKAELTSHSAKNSTSSIELQQWEKNVSRLSAIFKRYPQLQNTTVVLYGQNYTTYKVTSEGLKLQLPDGQITLSVRASILGADMVRINDSWSTTVSSIDNLPDVAELEKQFTQFAEGMIRLSQAEPINEYYAGPVLFVDAACANVFKTNLLNPGQLIAIRQPLGSPMGATFDGRIERKILDSRLTVKNLTALKSYNGIPLIGHYGIDAEGIVPPKELTLIENGILRQQLNGRIPTSKAPQSTGSARFSLIPNQVYFGIVPGILHISCDKGIKIDKMKKALLRSAQEENLKYAYIVYKLAAQASVIYRINTKTGEETQVRAGEFANIDLMKLKRLTAISAQEQVENYLYNGQYSSSIICPKAILVEDVEINIPSLRKEEKSPLTFPLERK